MAKNSPLLAFVHIEKSAGRSLTDLLHRNYLISYSGVRPLSPASERKFCPSDLITYKRLNPFLRCIAGHSIVPYSELNQVDPDIQYITLIREPLTRCVSHYTGGFGRNSEIPFSFEEYLDMDFAKNFQTKKICGQENAEIAIKVLREHFIAVGLMEQFKEFLLYLNFKLGGELQIAFKNRNVRSRANYDKYLNKYRDQLIENNKEDLILYEAVEKEILPEQRKIYPGNLILDAEQLINAELSGVRMKWYLALGYERIFLNPIIKLIRKYRGMIPEGVY